MKKLEIIQIMNLADKLSQTEWVVVLIGLNNNNQLPEFFEMIKQTDMLNSVLQSFQKHSER